MSKEQDNLKIAAYMAANGRRDGYDSKWMRRLQLRMRKRMQTLGGNSAQGSAVNEPGPAEPDRKRYDAVSECYSEVSRFQTACQTAAGAGRDRETMNMALGEAGKCAEKIGTAFEKLKEIDPEGYEALCPDFEKHWEKIGTQAEQSVQRFKNSPIKTASAWIRQVQGRMKEIGMPPSRHDIATIIAARQLGNAVFDDRSNTDHVVLSQAELERRATALEEDPRFKKFTKTMTADFLRTALKGQGEALEEKLNQFIRKTPLKQGELNMELYNRYQPYDNYRDYITEHAKAFDETVPPTPETIREAARMQAAYMLQVTDPNAAFHEKTLSERADKIAASPLYTIMNSSPERLKLAVEGQMEAYSMQAICLKDAFEPPKGNHPDYTHYPVPHMLIKQCGVEAIYRDLTGNRTGKQLEDFLKNQSPEYREMVEAAGAYAEKRHLNPPKQPSAEDAMKVFAAVQKYQKGREGLPVSREEADRFGWSMELAAAVTHGTTSERYLTEQINRVNDARGVSADHRDAVKPGFYRNRMEQAKSAAEQEAMPGAYIHEQVRQDLTLAFG